MERPFKTFHQNMVYQDEQDNEEKATLDDDINSFSAALISCHVFSHVQCLHQISKYLINYSVLTFHFIKFNVAPVPGIALFKCVKARAPRCAAS